MNIISDEVFESAVVRSSNDMQLVAQAAIISRNFEAFDKWTRIIH